MSDSINLTQLVCSHYTQGSHNIAATKSLGRSDQQSLINSVNSFSNQQFNEVQ